jgi:hypothetical protein
MDLKTARLIEAKMKTQLAEGNWGILEPSSWIVDWVHGKPMKIYGAVNTSTQNPFSANDVIKLELPFELEDSEAGAEKLKEILKSYQKDTQGLPWLTVSHSKEKTQSPFSKEKTKTLLRVWFTLDVGALVALLRKEIEWSIEGSRSGEEKKEE